MTREEAIAVLNMVEAHGSLVAEARDMAIKALEQQTDLLDKIKQARRELDKLPIYGAKFTDEFRIHLDREEVFAILDKLIESEGET